MNALVQESGGTGNGTKDQTGGRNLGTTRGGIGSRSRDLGFLRGGRFGHVVRRGENDLVNDVDYAVVRENVGSDDGGVVDHDAVLGGDLDGSTVQSVNGPSGEGGALIKRRGTDSRALVR